VLILASLLVWEVNTRGGERKKKSILDYDEADVERIFQQWEVRHCGCVGVWVCGCAWGGRGGGAH